MVAIPVLSIIFQLACSSTERFDDPNLLGYRMHVDYGDRKEIYFLESYRESMNLNDLFTEFSLRNDPSMRFITTNQSIEIYDVMGTRNNYYKEWRIYLDNKHLPGEKLRKGVTVNQDSRIELRFRDAVRIILQKSK